MKIFLTLALSFIALTAPSGLDAAQQGEQTSPSVRVEAKQSATREKKPDRAAPRLTNVKILDVDEAAKTVTVTTTFTFDAEDLQSFPKPGETISIWGDPPSQRMICHPCYCPSGGAAGPCNLCCFDYQVLRMTGEVTGVDDGAQTFTVTANDQATTFSALNLKALPNVGEIIDVTYTQTPGGPIEARRMMLCTAGCVRRPGGCICH